MAAEVVAEQLNDLAVESGGVLYSDAAFWDEDWIKTLFFAVKLPMQFRISSIFELLSTDETDIYQKAASELAASGSYKLHRAGGDVLRIWHAFETAKHR